MRLYILRHGRSPSAAEAGVSCDAARPLHPAGREDVRNTAKYLKEKGGSPSLILVSPLKRARQTAAEVAQLLRPAPEVRIYEPLSNQLNGMDLFRRISDDDFKADELILVGHQPQMGELANFLTGAYFAISPATMIALETDGAKARLLWSISPDELR